MLPACVRGCVAGVQILISLSTGDVVNADFRPTLAGPRALLHNADTVPFRLTRNFQVRGRTLTPWLWGWGRGSGIRIARCCLLPVRMYACVCARTSCVEPHACVFAPVPDCEFVCTGCCVRAHKKKPPQVLLTPLGVAGAFPAVMVAVARCLTRDESAQQWLSSYLTLLMRDEVAAFVAAGGGGGGAARGAPSAGAPLRTSSPFADQPQGVASLRLSPPPPGRPRRGFATLTRPWSLRVCA